MAKHQKWLNFFTYFISSQTLVSVPQHDAPTSVPDSLQCFNLKACWRFCLLRRKIHRHAKLCFRMLQINPEIPRTHRGLIKRGSGRNFNVIHVQKARWERDVSSRLDLCGFSGWNQLTLCCCFLRSSTWRLRRSRCFSSSSTSSASGRSLTQVRLPCFRSKRFPLLWRLWLVCASVGFQNKSSL